MQILEVLVPQRGHRCDPFTRRIREHLLEQVKAVRIKPTLQHVIEILLMPLWKSLQIVRELRDTRPHLISGRSQYLENFEELADLLQPLTM